MSKGNLPDALTQAEKGVRETQGSAPVEGWKFRLLQAEILLWQGNPFDSLAVLDSQLPQGLAENLIVQTRIIQGRALSNTGKFDVARNRLDEAEGLAIRACPELLGEVKLARGGLQYSQDHKLAEQSFGEALQLARRYHQSMLEAKALGSLSRLATIKGHYDEAIDFGLASLHLVNAIGAAHIEAVTRLNLGWAYLELGDYQQAIPFFETCVKMADQSGLKSYQQSCLNNLGRVSLSLGSYSKAGEYFTRALAIARDRKDKPNAAVYLDNLALAAMYAGDLDKADKFNSEALLKQREAKDHQAELESSLTTATIAIRRKEFGKAEQLCRSIIADKDTGSFARWVAEDELATVYVSTNRVVLAKNQFSNMLATVDKVGSTITDDERKLAFSSREADFYTDYIGFLSDKHDGQGALIVAELARARTLEEGLGVRKSLRLRIPALQTFLRKNQEVALDYWLSPERSYLWAVTPKECKLFFLPGSEEIKNKIERYQNSITNLGDVERGNADGEDLYRILISPAQQFIPAGARIVIIPDGSLGKLNFETLLVPGNRPHFWIRDVQLEEASSLPLFMRSLMTSRSNPNLLVIGNPVQASPDYPPLLNAKKEIESAAEPFPESRRKVVSGAQATPSSYAANKPEQYDLIHFATHGIASDTKPLDSAIILSAESENSFKLYARDILKIHLNAELVTISACYGAGERTYSGEGLVGLAWAFLRAGAHQVIAGLWKVDDQSTPELMKNFYSEFQKNRTAAEALRSAKLRMLDSPGVFRLPYYWASLQLYTGS